MGRRAEGIEFLATIVQIGTEEKIRYPAAALAYYAFVSFVPVLVLVFAVAGRQLVTELTQIAPQFLTPSVRQLVSRSITTAAGRTSAILLASIVLVWSSGNFVGDIRTVIERIEGTHESSLRSWVRDAIVILGSLGLAILVIVTTSILFALLAAGPFIKLAGFIGLWLALVVVFVPLYYVPSGVVTSPTAALPGAVTAAFGWTVIHTAVRFYAMHAPQYAVYGVLSGVIIILTSLYLANSVLLTGIIINAQVSSKSSTPGE